MTGTESLRGYDEFCDVWSCIAGAMLQWPGLIGYCDECGENPCTTWIGCQRTRRAQCSACGRDWDLLPNGDYAGTDCPCGADDQMITVHRDIAATVEI